MINCNCQSNITNQSGDDYIINTQLVICHMFSDIYLGGHWAVGKNRKAWFSPLCESIRAREKMPHLKNLEYVAVNVNEIMK